MIEKIFSNPMEAVVRGSEKLSGSTFILLTALLVFLTPRMAEAGTDTEAPNIIFIMVDDLGWNGLSSFGNEHISTPNLDRLADHGIKFTQAYVMPECLPTRAELLSGEYAARTNLTQVHTNRIYPNAPLITPHPRSRLPKESYTLAEMLTDAGYTTAVSGKWHLGDAYRAGLLKRKFGTEYFDAYGFDFAGSAYEKKWNKVDKEKATLDITREIANFIDTARTGKRPFFAYMSYFSPHTPLRAPDSLVEKYLNRGYANSTQIFGKASERPTAEYLAMIDLLDHSLGKMFNRLRRWNLMENTVIVFMSDNGALGRAWNNCPLRGAKGVLYEGGIRVPMFIHWPDKIHSGREVETPVHIIDIFPTFMEIADGSVPGDKVLDGMSLMPLIEGRDRLERETLYWHHPHYIHDYGKTPSSAIRKGKYKLVYHFGDYLDTRRQLPIRKEPYGELRIGERIELFNIEKDPFEEHNLSGEMPEKTDELMQMLKEWWRETDAQMPQENPDADTTLWDEEAHIDI